MSENTRKLRDAQELKAATALPTTYGAWESAVFDSKGLDELKLLLTVSGGFDGTSFEIKALVADDAAPAVFYTELTSAGAVDEATVAAAVITSEGSLITWAYGCQNFNRCKFQAKRTGGTTGSVALSVLGG